jgi:hypothetical protein
MENTYSKNSSVIPEIHDFWYFSATFNNISAISWRPVLAVDESGVPV